MADSFNLFGTDLFGNALRHAPGTNAGPLAQRFTVPPLSVLNAREGDWQTRKRAWASLGIESEVARVNGNLGMCHSETTSTIDFYAQKRRLEAEAGHELTKDAAAALREEGRLRDERSTSREKLIGRADALTHNTQGWFEAHGKTGGGNTTSLFDPVLCELAYSWFAPPASHVLDPFAGGSVRGIVAALLGRAYTGIDLRPEQIAANEKQAARITPGNRPRWITGDSNVALTPAVADSMQIAPADFVFSCPPYGDLEKYSDDPRDLSAMEYAGFAEAYRAIIGKACARLKPDRFACFVVGDFRDKRGEYRDFVSTTIAAFKAAGLALYNEAILVTAVGSLPIRVGKQFAASRKLGKTHQNVLVFVKGDGKRAAAACSTTNPFGDEP